MGLLLTGDSPLGEVLAAPSAPEGHRRLLRLGRLAALACPRPVLPA
ncbi:hypothetical protein ACFY1U_45575 [Streptomyces sp. NPDC001351]